jgi:hypothetical protein
MKISMEIDPQANLIKKTGILGFLIRSGNVKDGDRVLCFFPEIGRFSHCFMLLTVVAGED